jgi:hypothetical protein
MPERDRSLITAFGVIFVCCVGFAIFSWAGANNQHQRGDDGEPAPQPYSGTLTAETFWQEHAGTSESYQALCDSPIDASQADLCQQWRSAQRAEEVASYTFAGLFLSAGALVGLFWTVILSNKATNAATSATKAAVRSAEAAEKAYLADNRPWVNMEFLRMEDFAPGKPVEVYVALHNLGKTPALDTKVWVKAVKVRIIQIDKGHLRKYVTHCLTNAPHNTFESAVILPTVKMATRQDAMTVEELDIPPGGGGMDGYRLGLLCVCTYRSTVSAPDKFFHSTVTVLLRPDGNKGLVPWIDERQPRSIASKDFDVEVINEVASIE